MREKLLGISRGNLSRFNESGTTFLL